MNIKAVEFLKFDKNIFLSNVYKGEALNLCHRIIFLRTVISVAFNITFMKYFF